MPIVIDLVDSDDDNSTNVPSHLSEPAEIIVNIDANKHDKNRSDEEEGDEEQDEDEISLRDEFNEFKGQLSTRSSGSVSFSYGGIMANPPMNSIDVEGLGQLSLPLQEADLLRLKGIAEKAPFGKGFDTVHDEEVRDAWQIDAKKVTVPHQPDFFSHSIHNLARQALKDHLQIDAEGMGVKAHLYKMLVYEEGGHFLVHRDTEKEPGMFATYLLHLPVIPGYTGGVLEVKKDNVMKRYDFGGESSKTGFHEVVFYADCEHELLRVESGWRVVLAFNLLWERSRPDKMMVNANGIQDTARWISALRAISSKWDSDSGSSHDRIGIPLDHKYTRTNFSFGALKGEDSLLAQALMACSDQFDLYLVLQTKQVSGSAEYDYDDYYGDRWGGRRRYYDDEDEDGDEDEDDDYDGYDRRGRGGGSSHHRMDDVHDTNYSSEWIHYNSITKQETRCNSLHLDFECDVVGIEEEEDLYGTDSDPDEEEYEGYTGNAGPTVEYWYHHALLVVIPRKYAEDIEIQSNFSLFVDRLVGMIHITSGGKKVTFSSVQEVIRLFGKLQSMQSKLSDGKTSHNWYVLLAASAAIDNMTLFESLFGLIQRSGIAPGLTKSSYSSLITMSNSKKDWECLLYLINHEKVGWERVKELLIPIFERTQKIHRKVILTFDQLLQQYNFPIEYSRWVVDVSIGQELFSQSNANYWTTASTTPGSSSSSSYYSYSGRYGSSSSTDNSGVEYIVDAIFLLLERNSHLSELKTRLSTLIKTMDSYNLLQRVLDKVGDGSTGLLNKLGNESLTLLNTLVDKRLAYIEANSHVADTWVVPYPMTTFPPEVVQFLKSEQRIFSRDGMFNGIAHARNYASKYFGNSMYGVSSQTGGTGKRAYVKATKTSQPYLKEKRDRIIKFLTSTRKAKQAIRNALNNANNSGRSSSSSSSAPITIESDEPATKRHKPYSESGYADEEIIAV